MRIVLCLLALVAAAAAFGHHHHYIYTGKNLGGGIDLNRYDGYAAKPGYTGLVKYQTGYDGSSGLVHSGGAALENYILSNSGHGNSGAHLQGFGKNIFNSGAFGGANYGVGLGLGSGVSNTYGRGYKWNTGTAFAPAGVGQSTIQYQAQLSPFIVPSTGLYGDAKWSKNGVYSGTYGGSSAGFGAGLASGGLGLATGGLGLATGGLGLATGGVGDGSQYYSYRKQFNIPASTSYVQSSRFSGSGYPGFSGIAGYGYGNQFTNRPYISPAGATSMYTSSRWRADHNGRNSGLYNGYGQNYKYSGSYGTSTPYTYSSVIGESSGIRPAVIPSYTGSSSYYTNTVKNPFVANTIVPGTVGSGSYYSSSVAPITSPVTGSVYTTSANYKPYIAPAVLPSAFTSGSSFQSSSIVPSISPTVSGAYYSTSSVNKPFIAPGIIPGAVTSGLNYQSSAVAPAVIPGATSYYSTSSVLNRPAVSAAILPSTGFTNSYTGSYNRPGQYATYSSPVFGRGSGYSTYGYGSTGRYVAPVGVTSIYSGSQWTNNRGSYPGFHSGYAQGNRFGNSGAYVSPSTPYTYSNVIRETAQLNPTIIPSTAYTGSGTYYTSSAVSKPYPAIIPSPGYTASTAYLKPVTPSIVPTAGYEGSAANTYFTATGINKGAIVPSSGYASTLYSGAKFQDRGVYTGYGDGLEYYWRWRNNGFHGAGSPSTGAYTGYRGGAYTQYNDVRGSGSGGDSSNTYYTGGFTSPAFVSGASGVNTFGYGSRSPFGRPNSANLGAGWAVNKYGGNNGYYTGYGQGHSRYSGLTSPNTYSRVVSGSAQLSPYIIPSASYTGSSYSTYGSSRPHVTSILGTGNVGSSNILNAAGIINGVTTGAGLYTDPKWVKQGLHSGYAGDGLESYWNWRRNGFSGGAISRPATVGSGLLGLGTGSLGAYDYGKTSYSRPTYSGGAIYNGNNGYSGIGSAYYGSTYSRPASYNTILTGTTQLNPAIYSGKIGSAGAFGGMYNNGAWRNGGVYSGYGTGLGSSWRWQKNGLQGIDGGSNLYVSGKYGGDGIFNGYGSGLGASQGGYWSGRNVGWNGGLAGGYLGGAGGTGWQSSGSGSFGLSGTSALFNGGRSEWSRSKSWRSPERTFGYSYTF